MDIFEIFTRAWPVILALITLIIGLSKLDLRFAVLEDKIKTLFDLLNKRNEK